MWKKDSTSLHKRIWGCGPWVEEHSASASARSLKLRAGVAVDRPLCSLVPSASPGRAWLCVCRDHVSKSSGFACAQQQLSTPQTCWSWYLKATPPIFFSCLTGQSLYDLQESKLLHPVICCSCENIRTFNYKSKLPQVNGTTERDEGALMILVLASYVGIILIQQVVVSKALLHELQYIKYPFL